VVNRRGGTAWICGRVVYGGGGIRGGYGERWWYMGEEDTVEEEGYGVADMWKKEVIRGGGYAVGMVESVANGAADMVEDWQRIWSMS